MPTLKAGKLAYYDGLCGLIPVRMLEITFTPAEAPYGFRFILKKGGISSEYRARAVVTADCRPYRKGETLESFAHNFVPRGCVRANSALVKPYGVEVGSCPAS